MKKFFSGCLLFLGKYLQAQDIYVTTNGKDTNSGAIGKPVATLEVARNLIWQYKAINALPNDGFTVWIGKSNYGQNKPQQISIESL